MGGRALVYTRRHACALALGTCGAALLGMAGCSSENSSSPSGNGYASDCDVRDYPVQLKLYADADLQWQVSDTADVPALERYVQRYQAQDGRSEVSVSVEYVEPSQLYELSCSGFSDGDGLVALDDTVSAGCAAETVDGGSGEYLVRDLSYHFSQKLIVVRAAGSTAQLPNASTIDGNDSSDGTITRFQHLGEFDGTIALADPATCTEGAMALTALALDGFYDEESGTLSDEAASRIVEFPDQDAAMEAVASGSCQLGFASNIALSRRYPQVEQCYQPSKGRASYHAAALSRSQEPSVMRDFFEFINRCTD